MTLTITAAPPTDPPITLADGKSLTECISALPKPGCTTRENADGHQLAVGGILLAAVAFIMWRIARGVRRRPGPPATASPTAAPAAPER